MIDNRIPQPIADALRTGHGVSNAELVAPGMSGAIVFRCDGPHEQSFALRRWPRGVAIDRVNQIHHVLTVAKKNACDIVPSVVAIDPQRCGPVVCDQTLWDMCQWMPGRPLALDASLDQIRRGASAIRQFHRAVESLGSRQQIAPVVMSRIERAAAIDPILPRAIAAADSHFPADLGHALGRASDLLRQNWPSVAKRITRSLQRYQVETASTQWVLRDIHREHLLFTHDNVTGLVDFDAVRVDSPWADLVRFGGSFLTGQNNSDDIWEAILAGYGAVSPFQGRKKCTPFLDFARDLHFSSTWISLANWVIWLKDQRREFPCGNEPVAARINELVKLAVLDS
ncbi:MAG: aminoglycoside phosphotransferase family protein [Pirellulaceae bacterium]|nr:aminoglycoside phosphotransferase family protein [Pirellulaceae bacterium]